MIHVTLFFQENVLYFYNRTFWAMCSVPNMALCCYSLTSCSHSTLLRYFQNVFELVLFAQIITGVTFVFTFHMHCISIVSNLHYRILSNPFLITFLPPEIATCINILHTNKTAAYSHEPAPSCKQYLQRKNL